MNFSDALLIILTEQTCGEACWHAREDICRCSCGGRNHGCLRSANGEQPRRTAKIAGIRYELTAVGFYRDLYSEARKINTDFGYKHIEKPIRCQDGTFIQYKYTWSETDAGAPARIKYATQSQIDRWPELSAYRDFERSRLMNVSLLWTRIEAPAKPTEPIIEQA